MLASLHLILTINLLLHHGHISKSTDRWHPSFLILAGLRQVIVIVVDVSHSFKDERLFIIINRASPTYHHRVGSRTPVAVSLVVIGSRSVAHLRTYDYVLDIEVNDPLCSLIVPIIDL